MSIKRDLYEYVKTAILGGTFTDACDIEYTFTGVEEIKFFMFWNSELLNTDTKDGFPTPAVFFEYSNSELELIQQRISETYDIATWKDITEFTLHLIYKKARSEDREEDYLEQIDLADKVTRAIQGKSLTYIKNIRRIRENQDNNSQVDMDWQITFITNTTNEGESSLVDANDPEVNPSAPVDLEVIVGVNKDY